MQHDSKMEKIPDELLEEVSGGEASKYAKNLYFRVVGGMSTVRVRCYDGHGVKKGTIDVNTEVVYRGFEETVTVDGETFKLIGVSRENSSELLWIRESNLQKITPW